MQIFPYIEAGRFSFFQIFSFSKKLVSSPKQLKSPVEYMVLGEAVSLSADGECRTPNSSPGLMASPPSLTRSQKPVRPAASTTGCNVDGFTFGQRMKGQVGHSAPSTAPSTRRQFLWGLHFIWMPLHDGAMVWPLPQHTRICRQTFLGALGQNAVNPSPLWHKIYLPNISAV